MKWLAVIVGAVVVLYSAYALAYPSYSYRWRVTIEVKTTDGWRAGHSVLETKTVQYPSWVTLGANSHRTTVRGEATFVDLGNGRHVIALLALGPEAEDGRASLFVPRAFFQVTEGNPHDLRWSKALSVLSGRRPYGPPTLVTFRDLNDPATIQEVPFGNPGRVLGPDVLDVRAWVDLTKDPVTSGLEARLPWITEFPKAETAWRIIRRGKYGSSSAPLQIFKLRDE